MNLVSRFKEMNINYPQKFLRMSLFDESMLTQDSTGTFYLKQKDRRYFGVKK